MFDKSTDYGNDMMVVQFFICLSLSRIDFPRNFNRMGEQGWRSGENTRLPPMWPGFKSRHQRHMWVEFVVGSLLCSERFFSGYSGFPLSSETNISKFQFDQESGERRTTMWMCYLQIVIYLEWNHEPQLSGFTAMF